MADEKFKNSTCRLLGHDYRSTTSPTYRACTRSGCGAAQRLGHGTWITVAKRSERNRPGDTAQPSLFEKEEVPQ
jgi:hypothetical protein